MAQWETTSFVPGGPTDGTDNADKTRRWTRIGTLFISLAFIQYMVKWNNMYMEWK